MCDFTGDAKSKAAGGISQAGSDMYNRSKMTDQESQQYGQSFDTGNMLQQLYQYFSGMGQQPQGYQNSEQQYQQQGPMAQNIYNTVAGQAANPYAGWESSLQPNLQMATQNVNQQSNARGLLNSGQNLESLGRAGVELAVSDAQNRMAYGQQSLSNASNLSNQMYNQQQTGISNMGNLYNAQQGYGLEAMKRQAGAAQNAAAYQSYPYQAQLGESYGIQNGIMGLGNNAIQNMFPVFNSPTNNAKMVTGGQ
jgi:putative hemolysin